MAFWSVCLHAREVCRPEGLAVCEHVLDVCLHCIDVQAIDLSAVIRRRSLRQGAAFVARDANGACLQVHVSVGALASRYMQVCQAREQERDRSQFKLLPHISVC